LVETTNMSKGYPTPNEQTGDVTFGCISVYVPNNPEFEGIFAAAIYGLYASMSKEYFWREQGTMSPEQAAFLAARGLAESQAYDGLCEGGEGMSCLDVADCIDSDENVQESIINNLTNNGYTANFDVTAPTINITNEQLTENLLPEDLPCTDAQLMATSRKIVTEINKAIVDMLEQIELITSPSELGATLLDNFEGISWFTSFLEVANFIQDEFLTVYEGSYTQAVENNLSCAIYCEMITSCEISLDALISVMQSEMGSIAPPEDLDDYNAVWLWLIDIDTSVGTSVVAAMYYAVFSLMKFSASITDVAVIADLKQIINSSIGSMDNSYVDCDDCPPDETTTSYWMLYTDHRIGLQNWSLGEGSFDNNGIITETISGNSWAYLNRNFGGEFRVQAAGIRSQRRGSDGNGTNDFSRCIVYANVNQSGSSFNVLTQSFITCNTNNCDNQNKLVSAISTLCESVQIWISVQGAHLYPTNFGRILESVIYGEANSGTKPDGAVWVSSIPDVGELFPSP